MDIFEHIKTGETDAVEALLRDDPALLYRTDENGLRPVMAALYYGQRELAEKLGARMTGLTVWEASALGALDAVRAAVQADDGLLNAVSADGFTPLGLAAFFGQADVLVWLLAQGADPNKPSQNRMAVYPLNSAAAHREREAALDMVRILISHGAELNVAQHGGWTPLHQAASHGYKEMVEVLLQAGADPQLKSDDGRTAAEMARENGFEKLAQLLTR